MDIQLAGKNVEIPVVQDIKVLLCSFICHFVCIFVFLGRSMHICLLLLLLLLCFGYQKGVAEELSSVPRSFEMLPNVLKRGGYRTHMLGVLRCICIWKYIYTYCFLFLVGERKERE